MSPASPESRGNQIVEIDVLTDPRWPALMHGRDASLFSSQRWLSVLNEVYGFEFRANAIEQDGALTAAVAYSVVEDARGTRLVSLPFCDLHDPVVDRYEDWLDLTDDLLNRGLPVTFRTRAHPLVSNDERLETETVGVWHELDATRPPEDAMRDFATLPRRMIKNAVRDGLCIRRSTSPEDLRAFFDLHVGVRKYRHGLLTQPYELFESIASHFFDSGKGVVISATAGTEFAGGCVVLEDGDTAFYKFSASHPDYRKAGVSHATLFEGLRHAHERGLRAFDLGRSDTDGPGLVDFKRRFRPRELPLAIHRYRPPHQAPDTLAPTLNALTELLVRDDVPDAVSEQAGALLYPLFA